MSKTFKSDNELAKTISITRSQGRVLVEIEDPKHLIAINLSDNNAPALALAILEAAGWPEEDHNSITHSIMTSLGDVIHIQERITTEAREQAELEQEALELCNEFIEDMGYDRVDSWDGSVPSKKGAWMAVARKAREMKGAGK